MPLEKCPQCKELLPQNTDTCPTCWIKFASFEERKVRAAKSKKKPVNHAMRIKNWAVFYIVFGALNILFYFALIWTIGSAESLFLIIIILSFFVLLLLATGMLLYKTRLWAVSVFGVYILSFSLNWLFKAALERGLQGAAINNAGANFMATLNIMSLVSLFGIVGIFKCLNSAIKLNKVYCKGCGGRIKRKDFSCLECDNVVNQND